MICYWIYWPYPNFQTLTASKPFTLELMCVTEFPFFTYLNNKRKGNSKKRTFKNLYRITTVWNSTPITRNQYKLYLQVLKRIANSTKIKLFSGVIIRFLPLTSGNFRQLSTPQDKRKTTNTYGNKRMFNRNIKVWYLWIAYAL